MPHLKYVMATKKAQIHENEASRHRVPHYEGLTIEDILKFAKDYPAVGVVLPQVEREVKRLPRDYITMVCNTKIGEPFREWVKAKQDQREEDIIAKQHQAVEMDPEIAAKIHASKSVAGKCWGLDPLGH